MSGDIELPPLSPL